MAKKEKAPVPVTENGYPAMHEMFVPKAIFFTNGVGVQKDRLSSFELALRDAGIEKANLVTVSSIFPPHCFEISRKEGEKLIKPGQIVHCVMARQDTNEPNRLIAASIGLARPWDKEKYGYLSEHHSYGETANKAGEYVENLKFPGYELREQNDGPDRLTRKVWVEPPLGNVPAAVKKVIGDKLSYVEDGTFDKKTKRYAFKVIPSTMPDKTKTSGEMWVEKKGDKKIERVARISVEVKVFMVGGIVEERILADLKQSYEKSAEFTRMYIAEKG